MTGSPRQIVDGLLSVAWAPACAVCDTLLNEPTRGIVCGPCWHRVRLITSPVCPWCSDPLPPRISRCPHCREPHADGVAVTRLRAAGWYEGALRSIIHVFKYQGRRSLAKPLAALMRDAGRNLLACSDLIVPVPLHRRRQRERGFNQVAELAAYLGPPVAGALRRVRATPPQTTLVAARRRLNIQGAFQVAEGCWMLRTVPSLRGKTVVLADDVTTTGATLDACARVLRDAGAHEVHALTIAKVSPRPPRRLLLRPRPSDARRRSAATRAAGPDEDSCP